MKGTSISSIAAALLSLASPAHSLAYTNASEVPLYGQSPPVYPTPAGNGGSDPKWQAAYAKARGIVEQLTVEEKVNLTRGHPGRCVGNTPNITRLGIPALCFADAPDGIRGQEFVSSFPAQLTVGATFDRKLMYEYGKALGEEYRGKGIHVALLPVAGPLGRVARGGRNWEGFGADPYLSSVGMREVTTGLQAQGVIAQMKHWLLNEQEWRRLPGSMGESMSSNADDRTIHELYAFPFMDAVHAGAASAMCSYQRVNNSYGCQNSKLLNGILKGELNFQGFVTSDWDAQHAGVASAHAGLDLVMPDGGYWGDNLTQAVNNGSLAETRLNDMVTRILAAWYHLGQDVGYPAIGVYNYNQQHPIIDVRGDHNALIREIGAAGTVLVKNVNGALPLKTPRFLNIYGYDAKLPDSPWTTPARFGGGYDVNFGWETFNGTLVTGGGSGSNTPAFLISPFDAIQRRVIADRGMVRWDFASVNPTVYANADACLVFINAYSSESYDRTTLKDDFSDHLVKNVARNCTNTIVVMHSVGIRVVDEWVDNENVTAIVYALLPGEETGTAIADVLYGDVSPSGRLPFTVAKSESDYGDLLNSTLGSGPFPQDDFTEGLYIDYRYFDQKDITPQYEFGFGLSYSNCTYSALAVTPVSANTHEWPTANVTIPQGGHPELWETLFHITVTISNTGGVAAADVPQLYVSIPTAPKWQLRGFDRVHLEPEQTKTATFKVTRKDLSVWNVVHQQWQLQQARYDLFVGASSRKPVLEASLEIGGA